MTIIRAARSGQNSTSINSAVIFDTRLSPRALGVLVRLLARPDDWQVSGESLAKEFGVGRDAMRSTINELVEAGYMRLDCMRGDDGKLSSSWSIYDCPRPLRDDFPSSPGLEA